MKHVKKNPTRHRGEIRIIGGRWRHRRLEFPALPSLRPSPDAVRERVFNWLQHDIADSRCLDLFAGSGAFGLEAASRGAREVALVESDPMASDHLIRNVERLDASQFVRVIQTPVEQFLRSCPSIFDIVFMDPPFTTNLIGPTCRMLSRNRWITSDAFLYIESPATKGELPVWSGWRMIRKKTHGAVRSTLFCRQSHPNEP